MRERAIEIDELGRGGLHPGLLEATLGLSWTCPLAFPIMLKSVITFWAAASPPWATLPPSWSHANANYAMSSLSSSFFYFGSRATRSRFDGKRAIAQRLPEDLRPISLLFAHFEIWYILTYHKTFSGDIRAIAALR